MAPVLPALDLMSWQFPYITWDLQIQSPWLCEASPQSKVTVTFHLGTAASSGDKWVLEVGMGGLLGNQQGQEAICNTPETLVIDSRQHGPEASSISHVSQTEAEGSQTLSRLRS